jgi:hypothetical protein
MTRIKVVVVVAVVVGCFGMFPIACSRNEDTSGAIGSHDRYHRDRFAAIDMILENLALANIAFNTPGSVNLHETCVVQLVLGVGTPIDSLKQLIEAEGEKEGASIRVSNRMEARLTGTDFSITAITPEVQAVSRAAITEWKWEIKPKSGGRQYLHLTLSALLDVDGVSTPRTIRTFDQLIEVEVTWGQLVASFFSRNWQWLWAAVLVPIVGWLWARRKRRKANVG